MDSLLVIAAQILLVLSYTACADGRSRLATRLLLATCAALVVPAVLTSWLLLLGVPIHSGRIVSALVLVAIALLLARRAGGGAKRIGQIRNWRWSLAVPMVIPFAVQLTGAALKPESSIDGVLYHGPALANIVNQGSLFGWESANQYVYYADLQMVLSALWLGITTIVSLEDAVQAPYVTVAALSMYVLSNQTSRYRLTRAWLASLAVVTPVIWTQARVLYVDVAAAGLLAAGMALIATYRRENDKASAIGAAMCFGGAIATKPSALFAGLICAAIGIVVIARPLRMGRMLAYVAVLASTSLPFYLRNWISFANPFYPITTSVGPLEFPGILAPELFYTGGQTSNLIDPTRAYIFAKNLWVGMKLGSPRWLYDPREGGFGRAPLFFILALATFALIIGITVLIRRRRGSGTHKLTVPDSSAWIILAAAVSITFAQPNASDSRYVVVSYLLLVGFGVGLFGLFPYFRSADIAFAAVVGLVAIGGVLRSEANMLFGIQQSVDLLRADPRYNTGVDGSTVAYGDSFSWLRGSDCPRVVAQTAGGLGPQGMPGEGLLTTYQYGLWGDSLCNDVNFLPITDPTAAEKTLSTPEALATITGSDFLVVDERSMGEWRTVLEDNGIGWLTVATFPASDYFPVSQLVLELSP